MNAVFLIIHHAIVTAPAIMITGLLYANLCTLLPSGIIFRRQSRITIIYGEIRNKYGFKRNADFKSPCKM